MDAYDCFLLIILILVSAFWKVSRAQYPMQYSRPASSNVLIHIQCIDTPEVVVQNSCPIHGYRYMRVLSMHVAKLTSYDASFCYAKSKNPSSPFIPDSMVLYKCSYQASHFEMHEPLSECNSKSECSFIVNTMKGKQEIEANGGCGDGTGQFYLGLKYECLGTTPFDRLKVPLHGMYTTRDTVYPQSVVYLASPNYPLLDDTNKVECRVTYVPWPGDYIDYLARIQIYDLTSTQARGAETDTFERCTFALMLDENTFTNYCRERVIERRYIRSNFNNTMIIRWHKLPDDSGSQPIARLWVAIDVIRRNADKTVEYHAPGQLDVSCPPKAYTPPDPYMTTHPPRFRPVTYPPNLPFKMPTAGILEAKQVTRTYRPDVLTGDQTTKKFIARFVEEPTEGLPLPYVVGISILCIFIAAIVFLLLWVRYKRKTEKESTIIHVGHFTSSNDLIYFQEEEHERWRTRNVWRTRELEKKRAGEQGINGEQEN